MKKSDWLLSIKYLLNYFFNNYLVLKSHSVKTFISAIYQEQFCWQAWGIGKLKKRYYYSIEWFIFDVVVTIAAVRKSHKLNNARYIPLIDELNYFFKYICINCRSRLDKISNIMNSCFCWSQRLLRWALKI